MHPLITLYLISYASNIDLRRQTAARPPPPPPPPSQHQPGLQAPAQLLGSEAGSEGGKRAGTSLVLQAANLAFSLASTSGWESARSCRSSGSSVDGGGGGGEGKSSG